MPEICRFFGIVIKMFFDDHAPPHFHAEYGEYERVFDIQTQAIIRGSLPPRARGLVAEWGAQHEAELFELWEDAQAGRALRRLDPLP